MKRNLRNALAVPFGLLLLAIPVWGHHSVTSEYDSSKSFSVKGTLTKTRVGQPACLFVRGRGGEWKGDLLFV